VRRTVNHVLAAIGYPVAGLIILVALPLQALLLALAAPFDRNRAVAGRFLRLVGHEAAREVLELDQRLPVERVQHLGAVHLEHGDGAPGFCEQVLVGGLHGGRHGGSHPLARRVWLECGRFAAKV